MATPVFCCGFECGQSGGVGQHWSTLPSGASFETSIIRSGARSLRLTTTGSAVSVGINVTFGLSQVGRLYFRAASLPTSTASGFLTIVAFTNVSTPGIRYRVSDGKVYTLDNTTTGVSITTGVWYRLDYTYDTDAQTFDAQIDGVALTQQTGLTGTLPAISLQVGAVTAGTADVLFEDVLLSSTLGDYPLGAGNVYHFVPTADGAHNVAGAADFKRGAAGTDITNATTTAFQLIDEVPLDDTTADTDDYVNMTAPPNATDYVEFVIGPAPGVSTPTVGPRAVEVIAGIHQAGTGAGNMELRINDNGSLDVMYTATGVAGTTTLLYKRKHYADPPSAASAWVAGGAGDGDFNDLRLRFGSPGAVDANPDQYLDCVMIEAEFAPVSGDTNEWRGCYPVARPMSTPTIMYSPCR
jgi:hypothetical protein